MSVTQITTHVADALSRLLQQYKGKPLLSGVISTFATQAQEAENCLFDMLTSRNLGNAAGEQLDLLGEVVGFPRPTGLDDATYRSLLYGKIGLNVSQGDRERVISVYALITGSKTVQVQELFPAGAAIMGDGLIASSLVNNLYTFCQNVVGAGIRVDFFGQFDATNAFMFDGTVGSGGGFGDYNTAGTGGMLAQLYVPTQPEFAFDNTYDTTAAGFSSVTDPIAGGQFIH